jgi:hypothetical protein
MSLRIIFDLFSGRPNPTITLDGNDASAFLNELSSLKTGVTATTVSAQQESKLGYRGLIVEQIGAPQAGLAGRFRVTRDHVLSGGTTLSLAKGGFEERLLANSDRLLDAGFSQELVSLIQTEAKAPPAPTTTASTASGTDPGPAKLLKCPCSPIYEPNWWNDAATGGARQFHNNCYNYATNYRSDTYAQPGRAGGTHISAVSCPGVKPAAISDALATYTPDPATGWKCPDKGNLVALVIWPNWDFHFYRVGKDGFWTHKPGSNPVTNLDNSARVISDPRTCDRGRYTEFCSFMVVMHGHVKLQ